MKKMFTLMATVLFVSAAFAQYGNNTQYDNNNNYQNQNGPERDRNRDVAYSENRYSNGHDFDRWKDGNREKEMQVAHINREYDRRIESVKNNWFMNRYKKERIICSLEDERRNEIRMVYESFNHSNNNFGRNDQRRHW